MTEPVASSGKRKWNYHPNIDEQMAPFYHWPPKLIASLGYFLQSWSPLGIRIQLVVLSAITWFYFAPALERCRELSMDWIAQIWIRNLLLMLLLAGFLHLYFYTFRKQGDSDKYDLRDLARKSKLFHFNNQVWDNMFWTLASAVTVWTLYEVIMMWAYANGYAPMMEFGDNPVWFVALFILIPWLAGVHFYAQHRLLHVPFLYRHVHSWHHKNTNIGPWSGAAMHPVEHLIWLVDVFVFLFILSHPIHVIFILQYHMLTAVTSHTGFEHLHIGKRAKYRLGDFFHQLHHRYCDCNYGNFETAFDHWFNTYHDGTEKGDAWIKERRKALSQGNSTA